MTDAEQAAADARQAIIAALAQLGEAVHGPYSRLDDDVRAAYAELHAGTAGIVQRLGWEVGSQTRDLEAQLQRIADSVALHEQGRLNDLAAPLRSIQQRLGGDLLSAITYSQPNGS